MNEISFIVNFHYPCHVRSISLSRPTGVKFDASAWNWLLGPMITTIVRIEGEAHKQRAKQVLENMTPHFSDVGIGTVSEILGAEPPHATPGCMTQAWGGDGVLI